MISNYKVFIDRVISRYEGGYGWDLADTGGPTKYGITCWDLAAHRGRKMTSMREWVPIVRAMPLSEAEDIYRGKYAVACHFDELPSGVDCCWLDYGINSGIGRPIKVAQTFLGVPVDGVFGPRTLAATIAYGDMRFVNKMCDERMRFLRALRIWSTFGRGWTARVTDLRRYCEQLITKVPAPAMMREEPPIAPEEMAKSYVTSFWSRMDHRRGNTDAPFIMAPVAEEDTDELYNKGGST